MTPRSAFQEPLTQVTPPLSAISRVVGPYDGVNTLYDVTNEQPGDNEKERNVPRPQMKREDG